MLSKILHVSYSDWMGGADRAASRIHLALRAMGLDSFMRVVRPEDRSPFVDGPRSSFDRAASLVRPRVASLVRNALRTDNRNLHSPAVVPSRIHRELNRGDADVVHLHWIGNEMISISELARLRKPIVWTLHDMWAFCGAEHISGDDRWRGGYTKNNRSDIEEGFDLNRWVWRRKRKHWRKPMQLVAPSQWLRNCVEESALMGEWPVEVIPNPIDVDSWRPVSKAAARDILGLPQDIQMVAFGAIGGTLSHNKGFDILTSAIRHLAMDCKELSLLVIGGLASPEAPDLGIPQYYLGRLRDEVSMRLAYSAADVYVIPSRVENFPNAGLESAACATPIVAFSVGGLSDIVDHKKTGYLAKPYDPMGLAEGIAWVLRDMGRSEALGLAARAKAVSCWTPQIVAEKYAALYRRVVNSRDWTALG